MTAPARFALALLLPVALAACARLDGFYFDPEPAPAGGYDLSACPTDDPDQPPVGGAIPADAIEEVTLSAGGETLDARFVRAALPGAPAVLYSHGKSANLCRYWGRVRILWELGYGVLVYDYEGYGASTGEPSEEALYRDAQAALDWLRAREDVDPGRIVYYGFSLGAAAAIELAVDDPPAALVTEAAFASTSRFLEDSLGLGAPGRFLARSEFDSLGRAPLLEGVPWLITHGDADDFVHPGYAEELYDAAPGPKRLYLAPGAAHGTVPWVDLDAWRAEVSGWIAEHVL